MGNWDDGHMDGGWGLAMVIGMLGLGLLIAVAVGLAVVWTARFANATSGPHVEPLAGSAVRGVNSEAEQILAARMARGEIDTREYQARLDALRTVRPQ
jgi:putative membrane protein